MNSDNRLVQCVLVHPSAPTTLEASGLSLDLVLQLALKTLHFAGELLGNGLHLKNRFKLPITYLFYLKAGGGFRG